MSAMPSSGLVGVSTQIILVLSVIAARTASRSDSATGVWVSPQRWSTLSKRRWVPPYASFGSTTWSPGSSSPRTTVSSAARPEANANPRSPSSSAATVASRAVRVGLAERLYS